MTLLQCRCVQSFKNTIALSSADDRPSIMVHLSRLSSMLDSVRAHECVCVCVCTECDRDRRQPDCHQRKYCRQSSAVGLRSCLRNVTSRHSDLLHRAMYNTRQGSIVFQCCRVFVLQSFEFEYANGTNFVLLLIVRPLRGRHRFRPQQIS